MIDQDLAPVYTQARFFKCALQVNPAGYIAYRGQLQDLSEAEYNQQLLAAALEVGVMVIGLVSGFRDCLQRKDSLCMFVR